MGAAIGKSSDSEGSFRGGDGLHLPLCDSDIIALREKEVAAAWNPEQKVERLMRLSSALIHSRQRGDVFLGIGILEVNVDGCYCSLQQLREKFYLLAVGYYRNGDYSLSSLRLKQCLEIAPDWRQALTLQKVVEDKIARDGVIGMGITATAFVVVGLLVGGIVAAASASRKK